MAQRTVLSERRKGTRAELRICGNSWFSLLPAPLRAILAHGGRAARPLVAVAMVVAGTYATGSCMRRVGPPSSALSSTRAAAAAPAPVGTTSAAPPTLASKRWAPYPPGRWRLALPETLEPVIIWASHILVRHEEAVADVSFSLAGWKSNAQPVHRDREQALNRAMAIAARAQQQPARFAEIARSYSEDVTNREHGGSLGGLRASQMQVWPQVLDALATIRPGEVSDPVETRHGFHIFLRHAPPPAEMLSGEHIVISHEQASWSRMTTCKDTLPPRTRALALSLATEIFEAVQARPDTFTDAVQRYSDDCDVASGGDFGSWFSREGADFERRLDVLRMLAPGETSPPRETHVGFEIIRRTPERSRQLLAAGLLLFQFDPWLESSREMTLQKAIAAANDLRGNPDRFEQLQDEYCCPNPFVGMEGREPAGVRPTLVALGVGEISTIPVRVPGAYVLAKRLNATLPPPMRSEAALELPSPERMSLLVLGTSELFGMVSKRLPALARESAKAAGLSPGVAEKLGARLETWAAAGAALTAAERKVLLESALEESRTLVDEAAQYARYRATLHAHLEMLVLSLPRPML